MLFFFPLDEIWDLIESVSEGFLTYYCILTSDFTIFKIMFSLLFVSYLTQDMHIYPHFVTSSEGLTAFHIDLHSGDFTIDRSMETWKLYRPNFSTSGVWFPAQSNATYTGKGVKI